jgi:hypothetical protein
MGTFILILIFKFILLYLQIGIIFSVFSFLYMFALNSEKNLKPSEYFLMILLYPFVINNLLRNEQ